MSELMHSIGISKQKSVDIHPSAFVDVQAEIESGVVVGPGSIIGPKVKIGANTWIGPNVVLDGKLTIGRHNRIFPGACIGLEPQDLKYRGAETEVVIGDWNTIREYVTINRATYEGERTIIGNKNLLMAYCHLGHNCELGNSIVMSNSIQVAGHVVIEDSAVIGGCLGVHQFVHIGGFAMVGGMTKVDRDVPPYCLVAGQPGRLRGLNRVGIKRHGLDKQEAGSFKQLNDVWTLLFRSGHIINEGLSIAREQELMPPAKHLCSFLEASIQEGRRGPMPTKANLNK